MYLFNTVKKISILKLRITLYILWKDTQTIIHSSIEVAEKSYLSLGSLTVNFEWIFVQKEFVASVVKDGAYVYSKWTDK